MVMNISLDSHMIFLEKKNLREMILGFHKGWKTPRQIVQNLNKSFQVQFIRIGPCGPEVICHLIFNIKWVS